MADIDTLRAETSAYLEQSDPEAHADMVKQEAEALLRQQIDAEASQQDETITRITAVNGSVFALGDTLPWRGIVFQVVHLDREFIGIQAIGLTGAEVKRMLKAKSNA